MYEMPMWSTHASPSLNERMVWYWMNRPGAYSSMEITAFAAEFYARLREVESYFSEAQDSANSWGGY